MPTLLDIFGRRRPPEMTGPQPAAAAGAPTTRARANDGCIFGQFGAAINFTDGRHTYFLYPRAEPFAPTLYQYTLMPMHMRTYFEADASSPMPQVVELAAVHARAIPVWRLPVRKDAKANMTRRYPLLDARTVHLRPRDRPAADARRSTTRRWKPR